MTRRREAYVKRDWRDCNVHGLTEFAGKNGGDSVGQVYSCMACANDRAKAYAHEIRTGVRVKGANKPTPKGYTPCTGCKQLMPLSGICDWC